MLMQVAAFLEFAFWFIFFRQGANEWQNVGSRL